MAAENYDSCFEHLLGHEGGLVDHPRDPGGLTKYGISKRSYPNLDIRALTTADAAKIYKRDYWDRVRGDSLPSGLDYATFDPAVNSGVSRGAKWMQSALKVKADGVIGPKTLAAAAAAKSKSQAVKRACEIRRGFFRSLSTFDVFGRGWMRRVAEVEATAVRMTGAGRADLEAEATHAERNVARSSQSAAGSTAVGATAGGTEATDLVATGLPDPVIWAVVGLAAFVVILALFKRFAHQRRADAFHKASLGEL